MCSIMETTRATDIRLGIQIEIISIIWMVIEMAVSIGAGIAAGSVLLTAFGIDSLIELISGGILLWRLRVESQGGDVDRVEQAEHRAAWIVAVTLGHIMRLRIGLCCLWFDCSFKTRKHYTRNWNIRSGGS